LSSELPATTPSKRNRDAWLGADSAEGALDDALEDAPKLCAKDKAFGTEEAAGVDRKSEGFAIEALPVAPPNNQNTALAALAAAVTKVAK
jgi:hypothetical protein